MRSRSRPATGAAPRPELRRDRSPRAGAALVGARPQRPPHGALVRPRRRRARSAMSATAAMATARSSAPCANASAPCASRRCRFGAYEPRWFMQPQHMNPEEAIRVMREVGAEQALGHHWGTFRLTNEGIERPLEALAAALPAEGCRPSGSGRCGQERYGIPIVMAVPRLDPGIDPASRWVGARGKILWSSPEDDALRRVTSAARKCSARAPRRRRPLGR